MNINSKGLSFSTVNVLQAVGPVCLPEPVQEKLARLILARLPASILSTKICNEDRDGSPLAVMGGDGRYTQIGVGCTEPGDSWFYIKYSSLKNWINSSTSSPASSTPTTSAPASEGSNVDVLMFKLILK